MSQWLLQTQPEIGKDEDGGTGEHDFGVETLNGGAAGMAWRAPGPQAPPRAGS